MQNPVNCQFDVYEGILQPFTHVEGYIFQHIPFSYRSNYFLKLMHGVFICLWHPYTFLMLLRWIGFVCLW